MHYRLKCRIWTRLIQPNDISNALELGSTLLLLNGNPTSTAPHGFEKSNQLHHGRTDSRPGSGDGSRLYEVNMWMWRFGRGMPRSMSVSDAERLRAEYKSNWRSMGEKSNKQLRDREKDKQF